MELSGCVFVPRQLQLITQWIVVLEVFVCLWKLDASSLFTEDCVLQPKFNRLEPEKHTHTHSQLVSGKRNKNLAYVNSWFLWMHVFLCVSLNFSGVCVSVSLCVSLSVHWPISLLPAALIFHALSLWSSSRPPRPGGTPETPRRTPAAPPQPSNPALQAQIKQGNYKRRWRSLRTPLGPCGEGRREVGFDNAAHWQ